MSEHDWYKGPYRNWADKVTAELNNIRSRILAMEARMKAGQSGGSSGIGTGSSPSGTGLEPKAVSDFTDVQSFTKEIDAEADFNKSMGQLTDIEAEGAKSGHFTTEDLVNATYSIHEATHAMRGYLMMLDQMGLSKDQKKMVRDLEYAMMLVTKLTTAMNILVSLETKLAAGEAIAAPELMLPLFVAGGMMSASFGYASKLSGGQT